MIELKGITKLYNPGKDNEVRALDHINLHFEDKGMVFILGKSGSGKTTLLNMLGGLDSFDEGEIIIKGKSSKDFSQSDFDSYRNTFIGFIFQEYNVLNDFTIGKNLSIALELQGLKCEQEKIDAILKQVDLEGYSERMPYELSTGQKQRIAIARALIKSPDIILADEPTGALDSNTGKQILNTLKKISEEKLVIIITHDQEFAKMYADRIIEIADGVVINDTNERVSVKHYSKDEFKLIRSKLPLRESIKMGLSNLKIKPFRLIFTILLSAVAFTIFGLIDTIASYDKTNTILTSLKESNINYITYNKDVSGTDINGNPYYELKLDQNDLELLKQKFPHNEFVPIYKQCQASLNASLYSDSTKEREYYKRNIYGSMEITDKLMKDLHLSLVAGNLPTKDNEIVVTQYIYSHFELYGYKSKDKEKVTISKPADLIGLTLLIDDQEFIISGIIDTNFNEERYQELIDTKYNDLEIDTLRKELDTSLDFGIHGLIYFREGYFEDLFNDPAKEGTLLLNDNGDTILYLNEGTNEQKGYISKISKLKDTTNIYWKDGLEHATLADNEIIIPISSIPSYVVIEKASEKRFMNLIMEKKDELINEFVTNHFNEIKDELDTFYGKDTTSEDYKTYIETEENNYFHENKNNDYFNHLAQVDIIDKLYLPVFQNLTFTRSFMDTSITRQVSVVGFYDETEFQGTMDTPLIVSDKLFDDLKNTKEGDYGLFLTKFSGNKTEDLKLIKFSGETKNGVGYRINNEVVATLNTVGKLLTNTTQNIFYFGLGIALFASLLLFNFISVSIETKKRDIGILRAIGARSKDVFMIYFIQSMMIALINFVIASIGTYGLSIYINNSLRQDYGLIITLLTFSIRQVLLILVISMIVAFISSFIPVYRFAHKKPIETIRSL